MTHKLILMALGAALYGAAQGDVTTVTLKTKDSGGQSSWNTGDRWSDGQKPSAGKAYVVTGTSGANLLRLPENVDPGTFAGDSLTFEDGSEFALKHADFTTATANFIFYGVGVNHAFAGRVLGLGGTIDVRGTAANPLLFSGSGASGLRATRVYANMSGEETAVVKVIRWDESDTAGYGFTCEFLGDNSNYKGTFFASAHEAKKAGTYTIGAPWNVLFASQAALGAPRTDGSAKLTLGDGMILKGGGLALTNGYKVVLQGHATFRGTGRAVIGASYAARGGEAFYLGNGGEIAGTGSSVITLSGDVGPIVLDNATLTGIAKFVVQNGAGLHVAAGTVPALAFEAGGALRMFAETADDGAVTCKVVHVEGNIEKPASGKILVQFDGYPSDKGAGAKVALLTAANLGTEITGADFAVTSADATLASVLEGTFAVEEIDGAQTLVFTQTSPAIVDLTRRDPGSDPDSWALGTYWSDGAAPSADKIYRVPSGKLLRRMTTGNSDTFAGRALLIDNGGGFCIKGLTANVNDLRLFAGSEVSTGSPGKNNRLSGNVTVYGTASAPADLTIDATKAEYAAKGMRELQLDAALKGAGTLRFRYSTTIGADSTIPTTRFRVLGDNSAFTGNMILYQGAVSVDFKDEKAMGGPAAAFSQKRLLFESNATLRVTTTYAIADPTRGITFGGGADGVFGGRIEIDEGQTLTISNRLAGTTILRKEGKGTLVLCCDTNTFSGTVKNGQDSTIRICAPNAVANASALWYESGAKWIIDTPDGMTVKNLDALTVNSMGTRIIVVAPSAFEAVPATTGKVVANLVRFANTAATEENIATALERVVLDASALGTGWKTEVSAAEADGALLLTVTATRQGCVLYLR